MIVAKTMLVLEWVRVRRDFFVDGVGYLSKKG